MVCLLAPSNRPWGGSPVNPSAAALCTARRESRGSRVGPPGALSSAAQGGVAERERTGAAGVQLGMAAYFTAFYLLYLYLTDNRWGYIFSVASLVCAACPCNRPCDAPCLVERSRPHVRTVDTWLLPAESQCGLGAALGRLTSSTRRHIMVLASRPRRSVLSQYAR